MAKIKRTKDNLFFMPKGAFIRNGKYVYINISNKYIPTSQKKSKSGRGYTGHESVCIGVLQNPNSSDSRLFYANDKYRASNSSDSSDFSDDLPRYDDGISVGLYSWVCRASEEIGLTDTLLEVFGEEDTKLILDCATYILCEEKAIMQHFPSWARDHLLSSDHTPDDKYMGQFLKNNLSISKIKLFREKWFVLKIGDGYVFLCYDSTNVNCQAEGVFIVQKGHAKDDPDLNQVNTDYVVRQSDGLPVTYLHSPGSVTDIAQAQEMIKFIKDVKERYGKDVRVCLVCDRGYISIKNVKDMDGAEIPYILMLRTNFELYDELASSAIDKIKTYKNELECDDGDEKYGLTMKCTLYDDGPECCAHVIWSAERYRGKRREVTSKLEKERKELRDFIESSQGKTYTEKELKREFKHVPSYFILQTEPGEPRIEERKKRGRGTGTVKVEIPTLRVTGFIDNEEGINRIYQKSGIMILVTRDEMTVQECMAAYKKRDCVEKVFMALKSHLGMDRIGVTTEEAMHGKGLLWFVAAILHSVLFNSTAKLRIRDRKRYTVPAMLDGLESLKADRNLTTRKYEKRYKLTRVQTNILQQWNITEDDVNKMLEDLVI